MKAQTDPGGIFCDDRGILRYMNEVNFEDVKRIYQVENHERGFIRAWHGHEHEGKYVWVAKGSAIVCHIDIAIVKQIEELGKANSIYREEKRTEELNQHLVRVVLSDKQPKMLWIPPGNYNGFKTLEEDTRVIFFSTSTLKESADDDIRLQYDALGTSMWEIIPR